MSDVVLNEARALRYRCRAKAVVKGCQSFLSQRARVRFGSCGIIVVRVERRPYIGVGFFAFVAEHHKRTVHREDSFWIEWWPKAGERAAGSHLRIVVVWAAAPVEESQGNQKSCGLLFIFPKLPGQTPVNTV